MSSNLAVVNFSVGGTLVVSGQISLAKDIKSISSASFLGVSTSTLEVTETSTFNNYLPTSNQTPSNNSQLTTKIFVDSADSVLNTRITDTDSAQRTYIDLQDSTLNTRITDTDSAQRSYIDTQNNTLNSRITDTDLAQRSYIDTQDSTLNGRITSVDASRKTYIDDKITTLNSLMRTPAITISKSYAFSTDPSYNDATLPTLLIGQNQCIRYTSYTEGGSAPASLYLPDPPTCSGQIVIIYNDNPDEPSNLKIYGNSKENSTVFNNSGTMPTYLVPQRFGKIMLVSDGKFWLQII